MPDDTITIGVLALQGSFREHITCLNKVPGVVGIEVRTAAELAQCAGLIIPGGESTTMALVAEQWGLIPELQQFAHKGRPIWGTCAGLIFLANRASGVLWWVEEGRCWNVFPTCASPASNHTYIFPIQ